MSSVRIGSADQAGLLDADLTAPDAAPPTAAQAGTGGLVAGAVTPAPAPVDPALLEYAFRAATVALDEGDPPPTGNPAAAHNGLVDAAKDKAALIDSGATAMGDPPPADAPAPAPDRALTPPRVSSRSPAPSRYQVRYVYTYRYATPARGGIRIKVMLRPKVKTRLPSFTPTPHASARRTRAAPAPDTPQARAIRDHLLAERETVLGTSVLRTWERLRAADADAALEMAGNTTDATPAGGLDD